MLCGNGLVVQSILESPTTNGVPTLDWLGSLKDKAATETSASACGNSERTLQEHPGVAPGLSKLQN